MSIKQPKFIRDFSKKESPVERSQLAKEIREYRTAYFEKRKSIEAKEQEKNKTVEQLEALKEKIDSNNDSSFFMKIKDFLAIKKIKAELQSETGKLTSLEEELSKPIEGRRDLDDIKDIVASFYSKEKMKWAESEYSKEEISKYFTEEHLSSLSTEDYITLLQKFPGEMLTHVSRHGIRDHADLQNHQKGLGEFHETLKTVLQKKELRSKIGIGLQENSKEVAIAEFLEFDNCKYRNEALGHIHGKFKAAVQGDSNAFADNSSIHLAAEEVADAYYGAERGNEIFFAFPSAMIASQYEFFGDLSKPSYNANNDQYIWPDIEKGIPLDSGIAFIPADAKVDREHGSRYKLNESKEPQLSEGVEEILNARFGNKPGFMQDMKRISQSADKLKVEGRIEKMKQIFSGYGIKDESAIRCLANENFRVELIEKWGIDDEKSKFSGFVTDYFMRRGFYKLAENTISSREYWDEYFRKNPESRPKHIVYYFGGDPTKALNDWRAKNDIIKRSSESNIGFSDNEVTKEIKNEDQTQQRFISIAQNLVDKYFPPTDNEQGYEYKWGN